MACLTILSGFASASSAIPISYTISLANPDQHLVDVKLQLPPGLASHDLQLPVWNALYQVRDFSQYVNWVKAESGDHKALPVRLLNKSEWHVSGTEQGAIVEYEISADLPGPFGAQFNPQHAFFNLAEILMYPVDARQSPMQVAFAALPSGWKIATALQERGSGFSAENYDRLVDSPVEIGTFQESDYEQNGAHYRVVIDADPADYDMGQVVATLQAVTGTATAWMNDRPFQTYTFFYHFLRGPAGGGMEHANSTAIDMSVDALRERPHALAGVSTHEFFHLWNVKRIRPQSLEPIDYSRENYTRALWFSEGVTNTAAEYIELRAGLKSPPQFLEALGAEIGELQGRPAHLTQSAEQSSLDAWLEKYLYYRQPERSISYYNKGMLLGVILDLAVREGSQGRASLRDLFQWMNQNYAKEGRFFDDSAGVRGAAEAVCQCELQGLFEKYVAGTDEIPWNDFFRYVGLQVMQQKTTLGNPGFTLAFNFGAPATVLKVNPGSDAEHAGLAVGDEVLDINGHNSGLNDVIALLRPGDMMRLRIRKRSQERDLQWRMGSQEETEYELQDLPKVTPEQSRRREAWLKGEAEGEMRH